MALSDWNDMFQHIMYLKYLEPTDIVTLVHVYGETFLQKYTGDFLYDLLKSKSTTYDDVMWYLEHHDHDDVINAFTLHAYMTSFFKLDKDFHVLKIIMEKRKRTKNHKPWKVVDSLGNTPLHYFVAQFRAFNDDSEAMKQYSKHCVKLIQHDAFPKSGLLVEICNIRNKEGNTCLHECFKYADFYTVLEIMVKIGIRQSNQTRIDTTLVDCDENTYQHLIGMFIEYKKVLMWFLEDIGSELPDRLMELFDEIFPRTRAYQ